LIIRVAILHYNGKSTGGIHELTVQSIKAIDKVSGDASFSIDNLNFLGTFQAIS
jgi:hypothetical protein